MKQTIYILFITKNCFGKLLKRKNTGTKADKLNDLESLENKHRLTSSTIYFRACYSSNEKKTNFTRFIDLKEN